LLFSEAQTFQQITQVEAAFMVGKKFVKVASDTRSESRTTGAMERVCAAIVTYKPSDALEKNVAALRGQVDGLVIVDNGSEEAHLTRIDEIANSYACKVVRNGRNLGIAAALNIGVANAKARDCRWIVLFDQDSTVNNSFISSMLRTYQEASLSSSAGIVSPRHIDRNFSFYMPPLKDRRGHILATMTSGSMIPIELFDRCGLFDESLFIDYVDHEFCLRIRNAGYSIIESAGAELLHSLGKTSVRKCMAWKLVSSNHSAARKYYIARNRVWLYRRYYKKDFYWCWRDARLMAGDLLRTLILEDNTGAKLRNTFLGISDAIHGRLGKRIPL
jgi:rhamnosyltransferase